MRLVGIDPGVGARLLGAAALLALAGMAHGQYSQDFEGLSGSATGVDLTGQDGFYIPPVTGSTFCSVYTSVGNSVNVAPNPQGGDQFAASNTLTARSQRDITYPSGVYTICYDFCAQNNGTQVNNIGSFSAQPHAAPPTNRTFIILANYATVPVPGKYNINYIMFSATNVIDPGVGRLVWSDLDINTWYRLETTIDGDQNKVIKVAITNLTTNARQETDLSNDTYYLGGGATPTIPVATGFRLFNNQTTNVSAYDNLNILAGTGCGSACPCACNWDTSTGPNVCDIFDFLAFQNEYANSATCACDYDTSTGPGVCDIFDFLAFQNEYAGGCP